MNDEKVAQAIAEQCSLRNPHYCRVKKTLAQGLKYFKEFDDRSADMMMLGCAILTPWIQINLF